MTSYESFLFPLQAPAAKQASSSSEDSSDDSDESSEDEKPKTVAKVRVAAATALTTPRSSKLTLESSPLKYFQIVLHAVVL